jgi:hypothetical protein
LLGELPAGFFQPSGPSSGSFPASFTLLLAARCLTTGFTEVLEASLCDWWPWCVLLFLFLLLLSAASKCLLLLLLLLLLLSAASKCLLLLPGCSPGAFVTALAATAAAVELKKNVSDACG